MKREIGMNLAYRKSSIGGKLRKATLALVVMGGLFALGLAEADARRGGGGSGMRGGGGGGRMAQSSISGANRSMSRGGGSYGNRGGGSYGSRGGASAGTRDLNSGRNFDRPSGGNRASAGTSDVRRGDGNRGNINTGDGNRGNINTGDINRGNINTGDINIGNDIDIDIDGGWDNDWNGWGSNYPIAAAGVAIGAIAVTTAAVMGSYYYALPPSGCTVVFRGGISYHYCGSVYYRETWSGNDVVYVVENPP